MISSRTFEIDAYHIIGIIPYCDMFNHMSTKAHTSLLCDQHVCPTCGSVSLCEHDSTAAIGIPDTAETRRRWLANLSTVYLSRMEKEGNTVDMRAERDISQGEEIFSCYQEDVGDGKLLVEWGFTEGQLGSGGKGISWNVRDVVAGEFVARWVLLLQRGRLEGELFGEHSQNGEEERARIAVQDRLVEPADGEQFGLLNITSQSKVSINIIIATYLRVIDLTQDIQVDELETDIVNLVQEIERCSHLATENGQMSTTLDTRAAEVAQGIVKLVDTRLEGYHRLDLPLDAWKRMRLVRTSFRFVSRNVLMIALPSLSAPHPCLNFTLSLNGDFRCVLLLPLFIT